MRNYQNMKLKESFMNHNTLFVSRISQKKSEKSKKHYQIYTNKN